METIKQILMRRDNLTENEALACIDDAREALQNYLDTGNLMDAENICEEYFGLEPDYIIELF